MKDFLELAKERFSCRSFSDRVVEKEKLEKILEAGRIAPTAKNVQPQKIYVISSEEGLKKANECSACIYGAKTVLAVAYDKSMAFNKPGYCFGDTDASIVVDHMMLEAFDLGVDSCWVGRFDAEETAKAFGLPENMYIVALLPIGYRDEKGGPCDRHFARKELKDIVEYK